MHRAVKALLLMIPVGWSLQIQAQTCEQNYLQRALSETHVLQSLAQMTALYQASVQRAGPEFESLQATLARENLMAKKEIYHFSAKLEQQMVGSQEKKKAHLEVEAQTETAEKRPSQKFFLGYRQKLKLINPHGESQLPVLGLRDGRLLVVNQQKSSFGLWTAETGEKFSYTDVPEMSAAVPNSPVVELADGRVAYLTHGHRLQIWTLKPGKIPSSIAVDRENLGAFNSLQVLADGRLLLSSTKAPVMEVWTLGRDGVVSIKELNETLPGKFMTPLKNGGFLAIAEGLFGSPRHLRYWTPQADGTFISKDLEMPSDGIRRIYELADGRLMISDGRGLMIGAVADWNPDAFVTLMWLSSGTQFLPLRNGSFITAYAQQGDRRDPFYRTIELHIPGAGRVFEHKKVQFEQTTTEDIAMTELGNGMLAIDSVSSPGAIELFVPDTIQIESEP